jgi:hypothetical protein
LDGTDKPDYFELAKDVASMASAYGGVLLLQALGGSQLARYESMPDSEASDVCEAYEKAAKDRCIPVPLVVPQRIPFDIGFVVAVNVFPVLDRPVAVKVKDAINDRFGPDAYVFPVRLSTHAVPYNPENLPMLLNAEIRRKLILPESIPTSARDAVVFTWVAWIDDKQRPQMAPAKTLRVAQGRRELKRSSSAGGAAQSISGIPCAAR